VRASGKRTRGKLKKDLDAFEAIATARCKYLSSLMPEGEGLYHEKEISGSRKQVERSSWAP
jgi:hypothetical protein